MTRTEGVGPAHALLLNACGCGLATDILVGVCGAVVLPEGVTTSDKRNSFFVVHSHATKRLADVAGGCDGVGVTVRTFGVHVDQAHLHGGKWVFQVTVAGVSLIAKPFRFITPVDILQRLPSISTAPSKTKRLEAHGFQSHVAGKDHEVGP